MNMGRRVVKWAGVTLLCALGVAAAAAATPATQLKSLPIALAEEISMGGMTLRPDAPPAIFLLSDQKALVALHHNVYDPKAAN